MEYEFLRFTNVNKLTKKFENYILQKTKKYENKFEIK